MVLMHRPFLDAGSKWTSHDGIRDDSKCGDSHRGVVRCCVQYLQTRWNEDHPDGFLLSQTYFFVSLWKFLCYAKSDKLALHVSGISEQNVTIISGILEVHVGKRVSALLSLVLWNAWCALSICWDGTADNQCTAAACLCLRRRQEMRPWNMTMWLSNFEMSNALLGCTKLTVTGKPWALNAKIVRRQYLMSILKAFGIVFN